MSFNTYSFAVLFGLFLLAYHSVRACPVRRALILVFGYLFYAAGSPVSVFLLAGCTAAAWLLARCVARLPEGTRSRRAVFVAALVVCLSPLLVLKYGDFAVSIVTTAASWFGVRLGPMPSFTLSIVGISFFTFEAISYLVDVYRGTVPAARRITDVALYLSFFPNLTAGPIMRAGELMPQLRSPPPRIGWREINVGVLLIAWGLVKKTVIADNIAPAVDVLFRANRLLAPAEAWGGAFGYSIQIYCDFSGYSDMAIGLALLLGVRLTTNFRAPYGVVGFRAFWQRWHISLSRWLRDYVFTPVALRHPAFGWMLAALVVTAFVCGLWHGAAATFVLWGLVHGLFLVTERLWLRLTSRRLRRRLRRVAHVPGIALTFVLTSMAWVFFRAESIPHAAHILGSMLGLGASGAHAVLLMSTRIALVSAAGVFVTAHALEQQTAWVVAIARGPAWRHAAILFVLLVLVALASGPSGRFIYFWF